LTVELQGGDEAYLREVSRRVDMILRGNERAIFIFLALTDFVVVTFSHE